MEDEAKERVEEEWSLTYYEGGLDAFRKEAEKLRQLAMLLAGEADNLQGRVVQMSELLERCKRHER